MSTTCVNLPAMSDIQKAKKILDLSGSFPVAAAEVYFRSSASTTVEVKEQKVDAFERARSAGAGLRVFIDGRMGFAFTTDFSDTALADLIRAAVENARGTAADPFQSLPERAREEYPAVSIHDAAMMRLSEREKIDRVMTMEREAFAVDPRIKRMRKASASYSESETVIVNTKGAHVAYQGTACSGSIEVVAEEKGEAQAGWEFDVSRFYQKVDFENVGRKAARKALDLLGARTVDSVKAPVILDAPVAEEFLSLIAQGLSAENVQKKKSLLAGKLDQQVLSSSLTITDNGLLEEGMATAPSDDEGVPMQKKSVIEKGRLTLFLHNVYTAKKDKTVSTGNGIRAGFKGVPGVGVTNLYVEPGTQTLDDLIASAGTGLYVTEVMGAHTANPISGDFSVGATGFWIEKGKRAYPVREVTIAGNVLDLMKNVIAVGSDLRFFGRIGSPSLLVKELSIGGK